MDRAAATAGLGGRPRRAEAGIPRGIAPAAGPAPARPAGGPAVRRGRAGATALPDDQAPRRPALDVRPGSGLAHRRPLLRVRRPRRARAEPGPERLRARQAKAAAARPGGRAVLRGKARAGRLSSPDRLRPGRDPGAARARPAESRAGPPP